MRFVRASLLFIALAAAAAQAAPLPEAQLADGKGELRFTMDEHGVQIVDHCHNGTCSVAADGTYKTADGTSVPVKGGQIHFEEHPTSTCNYVTLDGKQTFDCEDRD